MSADYYKRAIFIFVGLLFGKEGGRITSIITVGLGILLFYVVTLEKPAPSYSCGIEINSKENII